MNANNRRLTGALLLGAVALLLLPWYSLEAGFFDSGWLLNLWRDEASAPALWQIGSHPWLALAVALLALCAACGLLPGSARSRLLLLFSALGLGAASALNQVTMNWAQRSVSPTRATVIYTGEPVWAGIFGRLAGERLPLLALVGAAFIVAGVLVSELKLRKRRSQVSDMTAEEGLD